MPPTQEWSEHTCERRAHPKALDHTHTSSFRSIGWGQCCASTPPPPPFDMIVAHGDSRFRFKVNHGGRVGYTITKRTMLSREQFIKRTRSQRSILPRGHITKKEIHLACAHTKKRDSPHIQPHPTYTNYFHTNNHKSQQNKHKMKHKWGRGWPSLFG